jgi:endonuclease III
VVARLRARYRDFAHHNRSNPLEELLFIMLSSLTHETNYRRSYQSLRRAFPRLADLAAASEQDIARAIAKGGLSKRKAAGMRAILDEVQVRFGRPTLAPLRRMDDAECEAFLTSLPLVGTKTARCVMLYSLGRKVFPVDAHCWRTSVRLGWVDDDGDATHTTLRASDALQERIPPQHRFSLHVNLLSLGRDVCRPRRPRCLECVVSDLCPSRQEWLEQETPL